MTTPTPPAEASRLALHDLFGLQGRVAYVSGGYGDIGSAIARGLAMDAHHATEIASSVGRVAEPVDVVGATPFFCSPAAAFVTGQVLYVDGGLTATQ
jgi:NAD(P)-dependent dehydrogenase (short-subunit alcohol dehydrogenase family)